MIVRILHHSDFIGRSSILWNNYSALDDWMAIRRVITVILEQEFLPNQ
jgi:hypothetical protein